MESDVQLRDLWGDLKKFKLLLKAILYELWENGPFKWRFFCRIMWFMIWIVLMVGCFGCSFAWGAYRAYNSSVQGHIPGARFVYGKNNWIHASLKKRGSNQDWVHQQCEALFTGGNRIHIELTGYHIARDEGGFSIQRLTNPGLGKHALPSQFLPLYQSSTMGSLICLKTKVCCTRSGAFVHG